MIWKYCTVSYDLWVCLSQPELKTFQLSGDFLAESCRAAVVLSDSGRLTANISLRVTVTWPAVAGERIRSLAMLIICECRVMYQSNVFRRSDRWNRRKCIKQKASHDCATAPEHFDGICSSQLCNEAKQTRPLSLGSIDFNDLPFRFDLPIQTISNLHG